jgi:FMN phosphatase YigB (HAD superfamily)
MSHAVLTGPIRGTVTLADGTVVDVRPDVVYVDSPEQAAEVAHLIGERHEVEGHPDFDTEDADFVHEPAEVFAGYEPHPDMVTRLARTRDRDPELAARVAVQKDARAAALSNGADPASAQAIAARSLKGS